MKVVDKKAGSGTEPTLSNNEAATLDLTEVLNIVDLNKNNLIQGLVMSEILGHPRALKSRGNYVWNSRF